MTNKPFIEIYSGDAVLRPNTKGQAVNSGGIWIKILDDWYREKSGISQKRVLDLISQNFKLEFHSTEDEIK